MSSLLCSSRRNKKKDDDGEQMQIVISTTTAAAAAMRKGPWTDDEDEQLVRFVRLLGERRWDFLAKVSGLRGGGCVDRSPSTCPSPCVACTCLHAWGGSVEVDRPMSRSSSAAGSVVNRLFLLRLVASSRLDLAGGWTRAGLRRTGKSCRLRWVNYLHPDLRRGRITADEERRIVELHAQWGGRWSRIASSLPGRTDNEIKNFWRTRARKTKALEEERKRRVVGAASTAEPASVSSPVTTTSSSSSSTAPATKHENRQPQEEYGCSSMDQLWDEIAAADAAAWSYACWGGAAGHYYYYGTAADAAAPTPPASPPWEYCGSDYSLWRIDDQEYYTKMLDSS